MSRLSRDLFRALSAGPHARTAIDPELELLKTKFKQRGMWCKLFTSKFIWFFYDVVRFALAILRDFAESRQKFRRAIGVAGMPTTVSDDVEELIFAPSES